MGSAALFPTYIYEKFISLVLFLDFELISFNPAKIDNPTLITFTDTH